MKNQLLLACLLLVITSENLLAQQPWAMKPYAITLPRVTTAQQSTSATVPQQAGNMVYNTEQKAVAVHNGAGWGYLGVGSDSEYKNAVMLEVLTYLTPDITKRVWVVPAGVTKILVELWGGGSGGELYRNLGNGFLTCQGGGSGGYTRFVATVTPGSSLTAEIGTGGKYGAGNGAVPQQSSTQGGNTYFYLTPSSYSDLFAMGGKFYTTGQSKNVGPFYGIEGQEGQELSISYEPRGQTDYVLNLRMGNGGTAYGVLPGGRGGQAAFLNAGTVLYEIYASNGSFPGGGGGCGYRYSGAGANGLVIIRW
jgi:hypothetical protein